MNLALLLIALVLLGTGSAALLLRNLIHSVLLFVVSWAAVAAFYLWAGAEFAAFGQILVYVGAVSMVVLFAVLLTRQGDAPAPPDSASRRRAFAGLAASAAVAAVLLRAIAATPPVAVEASTAPSLTVRQLGTVLLQNHAAALLVVGIILTVSLLGAVVIASVDSEGRDGPLGRPLNATTGSAVPPYPKSKDSA